MSDSEVGRFVCRKCGGAIVASGPSTKAPEIGSYSGPCPWECGAWVDRGFRRVRRGRVRVYRAQEWDALSA